MGATRRLQNSVWDEVELKIKDLIQLNDDAAWRLVFPPQVACGASPQHSIWTPWAAPNQPFRLPIDDFISELRQPSKYGANLKTQSEFETGPLQVHCPYFHARHAIYTGISRSRMWVEATNALRERVEVSERRKKRIAALVKEIGLVAGFDARNHFASLFRQLEKSQDFRVEDGLDPTVCHPKPLYLDRLHSQNCAERSNEFRRLEAILFEACQLLEKHVRQIEADQERVPIHKNYRAANAWKEAFAASLGYCWTTLTGKRPSIKKTKYGRDFATFVSSGFQSIGGDPAERWESAMRRVILDRPSAAPGDGFDRYEKDTWPTGTETKTERGQWHGRVFVRDRLDGSSS
jgi:hypothetical protein